MGSYSSRLEYEWQRTMKKKKIKKVRPNGKL
jgi:hypothetical protein